MIKENVIPLDNLSKGQTARVTELTASGNARRRMLDLGLVIGTIVEALHISPSGDPTAYHIRGAVIALRSEEAHKIFVELN